MYTFTILISALGLAAAAPSNNFTPRQAVAVASVDRYAGSGCTGTVCNIAGSGDLYPGCNKITDQCKRSLSLNYANAGCTGKLLRDPV